MKNTVITEKKEQIAIVKINRPEAYNSLDLETINRLEQAFLAYSIDDSIKGVVLTGVGKAFCAGGDLKWIWTHKENYGDAFYQLATIYHHVIVEIRRMPKPVVAAINGFAAGGGFSMALACDFRIMESSAILRQAYTSNGLSIDGGGTFTLPRMVGMAKAMEIAVFDPIIPADKALEWGLVTEVVEDGQGLDAAIELVKHIGSGSLHSFAASKALIYDSFSNSLEAQLELERRLLRRCGDHPNGQEGVRAFVEKRKPVFT